MELGRVPSGEEQEGTACSRPSLCWEHRHLSQLSLWRGGERVRVQLRSHFLPLLPDLHPVKGEGVVRSECVWERGGIGKGAASWRSPGKEGRPQEVPVLLQPNTVGSTPGCAAGAGEKGEGPSKWRHGGDGWAWQPPCGS